VWVREVMIGRCGVSGREDVPVVGGLIFFLSIGAKESHPPP